MPINLHPNKCICKHMINIHLRNRTCYQRNYVPINKKKFHYPRILAPTNIKTDFTVLSRYYTRCMYPVNVMPSSIGSLVNLLDQKKKDMKQTLLWMRNVHEHLIADHHQSGNFFNDMYCSAFCLQLPWYHLMQSGGETLHQASKTSIRQWIQIH